MTDPTIVMIATYWWFFIAGVAIVIPGFILGMFMLDRKRNQQVGNDTERLEQNPDNDRS